MRVIFYGTPGFAVPSLTALVGEGFDVAAVVTQPDKPTGRHRSVVEPPPVKRAAQAEELMVLQPVSPKDAEFQQIIAALAPEIAVVVGYGHILPAGLLDLPNYGSVNVHASLLPRLRGAAPIERAIMEGHAETGVTIMQMDQGLDTGPMLLQIPTPIQPEENGGELRSRLAEMGAQALIEALTMLGTGQLEKKPQDHAQTTYAAKLTRADEQIDFSAGATIVSRRIRALDPLPGAFAGLRGTSVKLFGARGADGSGPPGTVLSAGDTLLVACGDGAVEVTHVQPAGKQRMPVRSFVNGRGIAVGDVLS
jgi:methionyl-tRNA formyltransferase